MKISKPKIIATTIVIGTAALAGAGLLATQVYAATDNTTYPSIVQKIASTFNLDASAVAQVFTQNRVDHETERLEQLVTDGKITEDQKTLILAKEEENQAAAETIMNDSSLTDDQKHTQLEQLHINMEQWLIDNGLSNIPELTHMSGPRGLGGMHGPTPNAE